MPGDFVERGGDGTRKVDADFVMEILILNRDDGVLQVFRYIGQVYPERSAAAGRKGCIIVAVIIFNDRGLGRTAAFQVKQAFGVSRNLHNVHGKQHRADAGQHNPDTEHTTDKPEDGAYDAAALFLFCFFTVPGTIGRALARRFRPLGGKVPLLFGVYGDRLLLRDGCSTSIGSGAANRVTHEWTIP